MLMGNFGAQAISLLFYPVLVRIFDPQSFGIFGTFSSFMVITSIFVSGQLHMAFIKCHDPQEIKELLWVMRTYVLVGTVMATPIVLIINFKFHYFPFYVIALFPVALISYIASESSKMMGVRNESFKSLSTATSGNRLGSNFFKVIIGLIHASPLSLILSEISANGLSAWYLHKKNPMAFSRPRSAILLLKKFRQFPLYTTFSNFFQWGLIEFPVIILAVYYQKIEIGFYVLTLKILLQPLAIIGNSVGSITSKKLVLNHLNKDSNFKILSRIYGLYFLLGSSLFVLIYSIPDEWVTFVLGQKWAGINVVLAPLALLSVAKLSSGLHVYFYIAADVIKIKSIWKAIQLSSVTLLIYLNHHLPFADLLWLICLTDAGIDLLFTLYTVFIQARKSHG